MIYAVLVLAILNTVSIIILEKKITMIVAFMELQGKINNIVKRNIDELGRRE